MADNTEDAIVDNEPITNNNEQFPELEVDNEATEEIISENPVFEDQLAEAKDKYLRLYADFENFRRRTSKEKIEMIQNASEGLLKELIPIVDDFERKNYQQIAKKLENEGFYCQNFTDLAVGQLKIKQTAIFCKNY